KTQLRRQSKELKKLFRREQSRCGEGRSLSLTIGNLCWKCCSNPGSYRFAPEDGRVFCENGPAETPQSTQSRATSAETSWPRARDVTVRETCLGPGADLRCGAILARTQGSAWRINRGACGLGHPRKGAASRIRLNGPWLAQSTAASRER